MKNIFNKKILTALSVTIAVILINGCLEEVTPPSFTGELNITAEMLGYIEEQGDFANSNLAPALIEAQVVFDNIDNYLIVDLRTQDEYLVGHIENSINITTGSLYDYIADHHNSGFPKIVLVSKNGQGSAYYTSLIRLAGFGKVYSLKYGMASWNIDFADDWLNAVGDDPDVFTFNNDNYQKNELTDLPNPPIDNPNAPIEEIIQGRIKKIIGEGFNSTHSYTTGLFSVGNSYLICYGPTILYNAPIQGTLGWLGHPEGTVQYFDSPFFGFRSINYLQTLPNSSNIVIYSYNGQLSACMTAYLKILGYKVKTFLFGGNTLFYSRMITTPGLMEYAFTSSDIINFDYVRGNQ
jgi:rhodanese-related sulfurtransferase